MTTRALVRLAGATLLSLGPLASSPAAADAALDRVFDITQMRAVDTGQRLTFAHRRIANGAPELQDIEDGRVLLRVEDTDGKREAQVRIGEGDRLRSVGPFPGDAGNPLLMVFLETVLNAVSKSTGGSPFYIRNRIKDSFRVGSEIEAAEFSTGGETAAAERIAYYPFANETEIDRLGVFKDLEIAFLLSDAVPGRVASLTATASGGAANGGYEEHMTFETIGEVE